MVNEIEAKSILNKAKQPSQWFGVHYNMNIYRGCTHRCIYCDSRSECYGVDNFDTDISVKINAPELLEDRLRRIRKKGTIGTGAMSDPYVHIEKEYQLTRKCLEIIANHRYPVNIVTKSNMVIRDVDVLEEINKVYASVVFTITTADDELARKVEPHAPLPSERFKAMGILSALGIKTGITMMPLLPFINEDEENIREIVSKAQYYGAEFIYPSYGMTLRDRQRDYYYQKLDEHFPGLSEKYKKKCKNYYYCGCVNYKKLKQTLTEECLKKGIDIGMCSYEQKITNYQLSLFNDK